MLDDRKGRILQAIVNDYVETADPVGSEWLAARHGFGCKSATLRNEMAEMAERGYLAQPHTSAGRIPTDRGYRYYVDRLMTVAPLRDSLQPPALDRAANPIEEIVQASCRLLSDMTQYPSAATPPAMSSTRLHRIYLAHASRTHTLLVMLLSTGEVEHRLIEIGFAPSTASLERVTNYMNEQHAGRELSDLASTVISEMPTEIATDHSLLVLVRRALEQAARSLTESRVFLEGTTHILRQREFQDVQRLEQLLSVLEERRLLCLVLSQAILAEQVTVIIGAEGPVGAIHDCSVVATQYRIGDRTGGFIGVVGPTRMRYDHAVGAVQMMSRSLSAMLTRASFG